MTHFPPLPESFLKPATWDYEGVGDQNPLGIPMASFCRQREMHILVTWQMIGEPGYHFSVSPTCFTTGEQAINGRATPEGLSAVADEISVIIKANPTLNTVLFESNGNMHVVQTS